MIRVSVFMILMSCCFCAGGQDVRTASLQWKVNGLYDLNTSQSLTYSCEFNTHGSDQIIWLQKNGSFATPLTVIGMSGTWTDITTPGQVSYDIVSESQTGTLVFARNGEGLHATLDLSQGTSARLRFRFNVNEVTLTNP